MAYDALGQLTSVSDNDSTVVRTYNSLGRVVTETQGPNPLGGSGKTFSYGFDAAGRMTSIGYPDGTTENRNRDAVGRVSSVAIAGGATLATYQYAGGRIPIVTLTNSVTRTETFDALLRATTVEYKKTSTSLKKFEYVFNLADQRVLEKRHHASGTGDNYTLDSIYRTVKVKAGVADPVAEHQNPGSQTVTSTTDATYDKAQSRTQIVVNTGGTPTTTNYTSDALNFYTAVGGTTHVRDANGNLRDDGTNLYDYDYRDQLVRVRLKSNGSTIATYDYDATGRRIAKSVSGTTTSFYWVGLQMTMEYDAAGLVSRRHYGAEFGAVVSANQRDVADLNQDGSTTDYVALAPLYDGAFDCVGVLDHGGAVAESYVHAYDGVVTITNAGGGTIGTSAIGWQQGPGGLYRDDEIGLLYTVYRYYSPALGRFVNQDPLGRWFDGANVGSGYAWVANRYRTGWDPLGLEAKCCGEKYAIFVIDWNLSFREKLGFLGSRYVGWRSDLERSMRKIGITGSRHINIHQGQGKDKANELGDALIKAGTDPCFRAFVYFGHGAFTGKDKKPRNYTGEMTFDDGSGLLGKSFFDLFVKHKLDVCVMGMCGADAAAWGATVGDDGIYAGGQGDFYPQAEQGALVGRVDRAASRVAASRAKD